MIYSIFGWLCVAMYILLGGAAVWSAAHAEFVDTAVFFACSLAWFSYYLKNLESIAMFKRMEAKYG